MEDNEGKPAPSFKGGESKDNATYKNGMYSNIYFFKDTLEYRVRNEQTLPRAKATKPATMPYYPRDEI
jgi:hypothetical protein